MANPVPDHNAPDQDLTAYAVTEVLSHCLEDRDLHSVAQAIGISAEMDAKSRVEALGDLYTDNAKIRARISRVLTATTREALEQVRLSSEIELEHLVETITPVSPRQFWSVIWSLIQDGREAAREMAISRIRQLLPEQPAQAQSAPDAPAPSAEPQPPTTAESIKSESPETSGTPLNPDEEDASVTDSQSPAPLSMPAALPELGTSQPLDRESSDETREETLTPPPAPSSPEPSAQAAGDTNYGDLLAAIRDLTNRMSAHPGASEPGLTPDSVALRAIGNLETVMDGITARQREARGLLLSEMDALRGEIQTLVSQEEESRRSLSALAARVVSLSNEVRDTRLREVLERIEGNINHLMSANRRLEASIAPRDETFRVMLENLKSGQGENLRNTAELNSRLDELSEDLRNAIAPMNESAEVHERAIQEEISHIRDPLVRIEKAVTDLATRLEAIERIAPSEDIPEDNNLSGRLEHLESRLNSLADRLDTITDAIEGTRSEIDQMGAGQKEAESRIADAIARAASDKGSELDLDAIRQEVSSLTGVLGEIRAEQITVHEMLTRLAERIDSGEEDSGAQSELLKRLQALHERVSSIGQDVLVAMPKSPLPSIDETSSRSQESDSSPTTEKVAPNQQPQPEPSDGVDVERLRLLQAENLELKERCEALERCLDESSRREMAEILGNDEDTEAASRITDTETVSEQSDNEFTQDTKASIESDVGEEAQDISPAEETQVPVTDIATTPEPYDIPQDAQRGEPESEVKEEETEAAPAVEDSALDQEAEETSSASDNQSAEDASDSQNIEFEPVDEDAPEGLAAVLAGLDDLDDTPDAAQSAEAITQQQDEPADSGTTEPGQESIMDVPVTIDEIGIGDEVQAADSDEESLAAPEVTPGPSADDESTGEIPGPEASMMDADTETPAMEPENQSAGDETEPENTDDDSVPEDDPEGLAAVLAGLDEAEEVPDTDESSEVEQSREQEESISPANSEQEQDIETSPEESPLPDRYDILDSRDTERAQEPSSSSSELTESDQNSGLYNDDLIIVVGGRQDYDKEYRDVVSQLGARLERYPSLDSLDQHQIGDLVSRSDVLVLIGDTVTTVGGTKARRVAKETHRRCFVHHSAQPRSLRRFLENLVINGQV